MSASTIPDPISEQSSSTHTLLASRVLVVKRDRWPHDRQTRRQRSELLDKFGALAASRGARHTDRAARSVPGRPR